MKTILFTCLLLFMYPGKRQILLFYNDKGAATHNQQMAILDADKKGLLERDIVVYAYKTTDEKSVADKWKIKPGEAFVFLLIGKDGGEKIRTDTLVSLAQLYKTIDAMPMRRTEMQNRK